MKFASSVFGDQVSSYVPDVNQKGQLVHGNEHKTAYFFEEKPDIHTSGAIIFSARLHFAHDKHAVHVGLRELTSEQHEHLEQHKHACFSAYEIMHEGMQAACDAIMSRARNFDSLSIIIFADILDPLYHKNSPVGGLSASELLYFCTRLGYLKNITMVGCESVDGLEELYGKIIGEFS